MMTIFDRGVGPNDYSITWGRGSLGTCKSNYIIYIRPLPNICHVCYAPTLFRPVKNTLNVRKFMTK